MLRRAAGLFAMVPLVVGAPTECPTKWQAVYADMSDGDMKEVTIDGSSITIVPHGNNQSWKVLSTVDAKSCSANIDFHVPGKPAYPPVNLTATLWLEESLPGDFKKTSWEYTDPSGTIGKAGLPLNSWVQVTPEKYAGTPHCPAEFDHIYADMSDGDMKRVKIDNFGMTITPHGNNQSWTVKTHIDAKTCSASVDFHVPGKPAYPPVPLIATLWMEQGTGRSGSQRRKSNFEYTDPSGTIGKPGFPLNKWVQVGA